MGSPDQGPVSTPARGGGFRTTRWSLVRAAGARPTEAARTALDELARAYWYPLYAYARRRGCDREEARDLVQAYFARLIEREDLAGVDPGRGRFRAYLLAGVRNLLVNERERRGAEKRGGGRAPLSIDAALAEEHYALEPADDLTPELLFEQSWARSVLARTLEGLGDDYRRRGQGAVFDALRPHLLAGDDATPFAELAPDLATTAGALKVAAHRLRRRFGEALRDEIAETVDGDPGAVEEELGHLREVLGG